jgi:hypothetical protein
MGVVMAPSVGVRAAARERLCPPLDRCRVKGGARALYLVGMDRIEVA